MRFQLYIIQLIFLLNMTGTFAKENVMPGTLHSFHLNNGEIRGGYVDGEKEDGIRIHVPLKTSSPSEDSRITVLLKRNSIQKVIPLECHVWESATKEKNKALLEHGWNKVHCLLGLPGARVGKLGNALGQLLIEEAASLKGFNTLNKKSTQAEILSSNIQSAQQLYTLIEEKSSDEEEKLAARLGRLRIKIIEGKNSEVMAEVETWIENSTDPSCEAWDIFSESSLIEIEQLVQEHPCWQEDRFVKPRITALLNTCLDASLTPFVRHPARQEFAAAGLLRSARIYSIARNTSLQKQVARDVLNLYPQFKKQAEFILEAIQKKEEGKNDASHSNSITKNIM